MTDISLFNLQSMPVVGLGLWQCEDENEFEIILENALQIGYRYFDTAYTYKNEAILGKVLNKLITTGKIQRNELFISTKLPQIGMNPDKVEHFLDKSLNALQMDYVDAYLVHFPVGFDYVNDSNIAPKNSDGSVKIDFNTDLVSIWKCMEKLVKCGKSKAIGLSNFNANQIQRIMESCTIQPAILQVELNVYIQQVELRSICNNYKIRPVGYGNFGSPSREIYFKKSGRIQHDSNFKAPAILEDPVVNSISKVYNKTPAQIILRYLNQMGITVIPGSKTLEQLKQNFEIFDFNLETEHMKLLSGLDKGDLGRSFKMEFFIGASKHPEFPFHTA